MNFRITKLSGVAGGLLSLAAAGLLLTACGGTAPASESGQSSANPATATAPAAPPGGTTPSGAPPPAAPSDGATPAATAPATATPGTAPAAPTASDPAAPPAPLPEPLNVVAGNVVLADLTRQVGGDRVSVRSLVPPGGDAHSWQSTPADSVRIAQARVVISNGAGLSAVVDDLIANAAPADATQVVASEGLTAQELATMSFPGDDDHADEHGHGHGQEGSDDDHGDGDDDDHADGDDDHADGDDDHADGDDDHADGDDDHADGDDDHADGDDDHADGDDDHADGDDDHADGDDDHADGDDDHADGDDDHADGDDDHADGDDDHGDGDDDHGDGDDDHGDGDEHEDEHGHGHGGGDPHFWQNPRLVVHYVNQIAAGLAAADPAGAAVYQANAAAYVAELEALDEYIAGALAAIPTERRTLTTFHDAFGYFGARYGIEVLAFVGSHGGDVSPDDIVRVLELVQERGLPGVFAEPQFAADALEQVARDAGIAVGTIRSLPDAEGMGYIEMMRANADTLATLLQ